MVKGSKGGSVVAVSAVANLGSRELSDSGVSQQLAVVDSVK